MIKNKTITTTALDIRKKELKEYNESKYDLNFS